VWLAIVGCHDRLAVFILPLLLILTLFVSVYDSPHRCVSLDQPLHLNYKDTPMSANTLRVHSETGTYAQGDSSPARFAHRRLTRPNCDALLFERVVPGKTGAEKISRCVHQPDAARGYRGADVNEFAWAVPWIFLRRANAAGMRITRTRYRLAAL